MKYTNSLSFARTLDKKDSLRDFRKQFHFPRVNNKPAVYMLGNSLGLQPKTAKNQIQQELDAWAEHGVEGYFKGRKPWMHYHLQSKKILADIVGAKPSEVIAMNQLTMNLHLMLVSFYRPTAARFKIIVEAGAFPSDQYAFETQIKFHGLDPDKVLIEIKPRDGEYTIRTEDIVATIQAQGNQLALVLIGGVQYYTGQFFDLKTITQAAHAVGAFAGFDLAHAAGNVPLNLHDDGVDFAVWCSYKYLNSGPGGIAGCFVHERFESDTSIPRLAGWWGYDEQERFQMKKGFKPMKGVDGWQLSSTPVFQGAAHVASLEIFRKAKFKSLRKKSVLLTGYLEFLLKEIDPQERHCKIITPSNPAARGCQLSILCKQNGKDLYNQLMKGGIMTDWREPGVIRFSPVPLYNSFEDVYRVGEALGRIIGGR
jgi:kynureninase